MAASTGKLYEWLRQQNGIKECIGLVAEVARQVFISVHQLYG